MSKRTSIVALTISHIASNTNSRGYRGFRYMHQINDFPCFCFHTETESRIWTDSPYGILKSSIRGYVYSDMLDDVEAYARDIERAVQTLGRDFRESILDARVITVRTDEGLMKPYGVVDMQVEILYRVKTDHTVDFSSNRFTFDSTVLHMDRGI